MNFYVFCYKPGETDDDLIKAWDMGKGFKMPELYKTGYTVSALSVALALALAAM